MTSMSEKEYYQLSVSVSKAVNMMEAPLKLKHSRLVIITTHRTKECKTFWAIVSQQPLMEHRFTSWKFCHLLHKVLREGHHSAIKQSQSHKSMLKEMGKLWGHLQDGVGNCIQAYCQLLVTKLDFHDKNAFLPGSLNIPFLHIEKFAGDDINVYFQLGVEIFDYLEDIISVQDNVFRSVDAYRMSSMSPQGQCRLAPLITLIQDSNPLYDCCVRIMFKLHHNLPNDVLSGHRDRFREMFTKLKHFYDKTRPLQYFQDLIQVPILPESAPNFTSRIDFGNYIPPVVTVPEQEEPEPVTEHLVDVSISNDNITVEAATETREHAEYRETIRNYEQALHAKNMTLENIEYQLQNLKSSYTSMEEKYQQEIIELRNEIRQLHSELKSTKEAHSNIEITKQDLEHQITNSNILSQKAIELQEKCKQSEEKFLKLKTMYSEMREEHIKLLRQNAETKKELCQEKQMTEELKSEQKAVMKELEEIRGISALSSSEKTDLENMLADKSKDLMELQRECVDLRKEIASFKSIETIKTIEIAKTKEDLRENVKELEATKALTSTLKNTLAETEVMLSEKINEHLEKIAGLERNLTEKESFIDHLKESHSRAVKNVTEERDELFEKYESLSNVFQNREDNYKELSQKMSLTEEKFKELLESNAKLETKCAESISEIQSIRTDKSFCEVNYKNTIALLLDNVFRTTCSVVSGNFNESGQQCFERSFQILAKVQQLLDELKVEYRKHEEEGSHEKLVAALMMLGYHICTLRELCMLVYNTTTDIEKGQKIFDMLLSLAEPIELLFGGIQSKVAYQTLEKRIAPLKVQLEELENLLRGLTKQLGSNVDLGDMIESELAEMEKAIAEAAEKFVELLSHTRSTYDGIKLEVNEKILDACNNLMECIKRLIKQSKILQDEIVSSGRGRISAKEFYKRNSEWTEGLISASKSVAKGANFLVEAANKAVGSDSGQNFEIIVAAQEIAACTAQLVISSKVKAPKGSDKLQDLTKASRMVSQATGAVVAIVKDSNQRLENYTDVDLSKLTSSQAKTMEMDIHVKVLELEQALQMERLKLYAFRRTLYQNSEN